ncbi:hypothetical protein K3G39_13675 [Pontibacter sp. HSC-14F20]|uniref:hypothetical protein n=1 Tax=Pontibacter sp. HSC-14F20 TaxID=2864136 RepID=UPI001C72B941|nr:hypothetical protein [Pontibacter sp. HSC-14F20]MBX0334288.1 hypothetical protein [Pontibacter sp. HSC-14F20]
MSWLPMYLAKQDVKLLNNWLNQEEELAFLISNGNSKWISKKEHVIIEDLSNQESGVGFVEYNLWHVPSGSLPLLGLNSVVSAQITDPWTGWTEVRPGANPTIPYFGAGHPGVINLEIKIAGAGEIPISNFGWIGNHYRIIGNGADRTTEKFWNKLKRMAKKEATQIPRCNDPIGKKEIYAFPAAYKEIGNGRLCSLN